MSTSIRPARRRQVAALTFAAALALTGCSGSEDTAAQDPTTATGSVPATTEGSTDAPDQESDSREIDPDEAASAADAGVVPAELPEPVATFKTSAQYLDDPDATLTYEVFPLQRSGELLTFVARLSLDSTRSGKANLAAVMGTAANFAIPVTLVDAVNLRRHAIVSAASERLSSEPIAMQIGAGQSRFVSAVFAAPPEDVTTMTVLVEGAPALAEVPIR